MANSAHDGNGGQVVPLRARTEQGGAIASGGGPPHDSDMEARVTRLEDQFARIEALLKSIDERVRKMEIDAGELKGRLTAMPSTWAMIATVIGGQVALAGLLLGALKLAGGR